MATKIEVQYESQVVFLSNGRGRFAVSVDGGDTVVLSNGQTMSVEGSVWRDADDEDEAERNLSPAQVRVLAEVRARPPATGMEAIVLRHKESRRARRGYYARPEAPVIEVPEGALVVKSEFDD